jgi:hypothetical protein
VDGRGLVAADLLLEVGPAAFLIVALRGRALGEHFVNVLVWELIALACGLLGRIAEGTACLAFWGFAVAVNGGAGSLHCLPGRGQRPRSRADLHRGRASH